MKPESELMDGRARSDHDTVRVVLRGGPADLPSEIHLRQNALADGRIKVPRRGGYEHFELVDDEDRSENGGSPVFRWTMRTKVAE